MNDIRKNVFYPYPPELVWRALTEPGLLADWLMANDIVPRVGSRFAFTMPARPGFSGIIDCEVLEADAPRRLVYSWAGRGSKAPPQRVTWVLAREANGTRLTLEHTGFDGLLGYFLRAMMNGGWGRKLTNPAFFTRALQRAAAETQAP